MSIYPDTKDIEGIPNVNLSCYAASLVQCLRSSLSRHRVEASLLEKYISGNDSEGVPSIWNYVDGRMQDPHEFYMKFMDRLPKSISDHFMIQYEEGNKMPCLLVSNTLENSYGSIVRVPDIICVYCTPLLRKVEDISSLEIDTKVAGITTTNRYKINSCICYIHGENGTDALIKHGYIPSVQGADHYYALVNGNKGWTVCDDNSITRLEDNRSRFPIYMIFYTKQ